jgi:hypothetical protein
MPHQGVGGRTRRPAHLLVHRRHPDRDLGARGSGPGERRNLQAPERALEAEASPARRREERAEEAYQLRHAGGGTREGHAVPLLVDAAGSAAETQHHPSAGELIEVEGGAPVEHRERVKAFAMAVPMRIRPVAWAMAPSVANPCWLKNSAAKTESKPAASARRASSTLARAPAPVRISPITSPPPPPVSPPGSEAAQVATVDASASWAP